MSGWRQFAESIRQKEDAGTIETKGTKPPVEAGFVPIVPFVPGAPVDPAKVLRQWHEQLSRLDVHAVPAGLDRRDWWQKCEDAWWLYENFASRAVRDGWSVADLFGVLPGKWAWGSVTDRLKGARDLKMTADTAAWTVSGVRESFCRGAGDDLIPAGLAPLWEVI